MAERTLLTIKVFLPFLFSISTVTSLFLSITFKTFVDVKILIQLFLKFFYKND